MKTLKVLNHKGDETLASWAAIDTAAFLHAQQVVREKIREGHILIDTDKEEKVDELGSAESYMLVPQIQGGRCN